MIIITVNKIMIVITEQLLVCVYKLYTDQWRQLQTCNSFCFLVGYEFASALAKRSLNLVIISRSADKLKDVSEQLAGKHNVEVRTIQADFASTDIYDRIEEELKGLDIAVLVNNVGVMQQQAGLFLQIPNL